MPTQRAATESAGDGHVFIEGTPESVAACETSQTGRVLAEPFPRRTEALAELDVDEAAMGDCSSSK